MTPKILGGFAISWFGWLLLEPWASIQARYEERDRWFCVGAASWGELRSTGRRKGSEILELSSPRIKENRCVWSGEPDLTGWVGVG